MIGGFTMKHKLKDPGSAITHLIGMILAAIVSIPLIIKSFLRKLQTFSSILKEMTGKTEKTERALLTSGRI